MSHGVMLTPQWCHHCSPFDPHLPSWAEQTENAVCRCWEGLELVGVVNRKEASNAKRWRAWEHQRCWCRQTSLAGVVYRIRNEILLFLNAYLDVNEANAPLDEDDRSGGSGRGFGAGSPSCAKFMGINRLEGRSPSRPWTLLFGPCERFTNNQLVTKKSSWNI